MKWCCSYVVCCHVLCLVIKIRRSFGCFSVGFVQYYCYYLDNRGLYFCCCWRCCCSLNFPHMINFFLHSFYLLSSSSALFFSLSLLSILSCSRCPLASLSRSLSLSLFFFLSLSLVIRSLSLSLSLSFFLSLAPPWGYLYVLT